MRHMAVARTALEAHSRCSGPDLVYLPGQPCVQGVQNATDKEGQLEFAQYDQFLSQQVAHFLRRLSEYSDRNSPVLDNTIVLFGSGASIGLRHGSYRRDGESRMADMYLSILHALGVEEESFADSSGTLSSSVFGLV